MPKKKDSEKDTAAVSLGRRGGLAAAGKGPRAYWENMTPEERAEAVEKARLARWAKKSEKERSEGGQKLAEARRKKREQE